MSVSSVSATLEGVADTGKRPYQVGIRYRRDRPYDVVLTVWGLHGPKDFLISRYTLFEGVAFLEAGDSVVKIRFMPARDVYVLTLSRQYEYLIIEVTGADLREIVRKMGVVVPLGSESEHVDWQPWVDLLSSEATS